MTAVVSSVLAVVCAVLLGQVASPVGKALIGVCLVALVTIALLLGFTA